MTPPPLDVARLRAALALKDTELESTPSLDAGQVSSYLAGGGIRKQLDRLDAILGTAKRDDTEVKNEVQASAERALWEIASCEQLSTAGVVGLEALILLTGRPALRVTGGDINVDDPRATEWYGPLVLARMHGKLKDRLSRVCRIDSDGAHVGTGYVCGNGLVMTNRHVIQAFASPIPSRNHQKEWKLNSDDVVVDFADSPDPAVTQDRFRVLSVVGSGPNEIDPRQLDTSLLDIAVLRVEETNAAGTALPSPLALLSGGGKSIFNKMLFAVGYPASPQSLPSGKARGQEVLTRLVELFDEGYSVKYLSPGLITGAASGRPDSSDFWTLRHDATTLGGSSGSCLITPDNPMGVIGLHFGGAWLERNYAHALHIVRKQSSFMSPLPLLWHE